MKHLLILAITAIGLSACSSTWHGVKEDTANNIDHTREAVRKAVGRGISNVGEKLENATE